MTPPVSLIVRAAEPGREPSWPTVRTAYRSPLRTAGRVAEKTSGWGLGAPGVRAEEAPPSPGWSSGSPGEPFHLTAGRVLIGFRALARAEAAVTAAQAADLALLRERRLFRPLGFASFGDFTREVLHTSPRSATRRVALRRVLARAPLLERAFLAGRVSACRALALAPVAADLALPFWIELAGSVSVRELEVRVREARRAAADPVAAPDCEAPPDEAGATVAFASPDSDAPPEEVGATVTFAAPRAAAIAWEQGMEMARRVLGFEAPRYRCVEAILDEAWSDLAAAAGGPPPESWSGFPPDPPRGSRPGPVSGPQRAATGGSSDHVVSSGTAAPDARSVLPPSTKRLGDLRDTLAEVERTLADLQALASRPAAPASPAGGDSALPPPAEGDHAPASTLVGNPAAHVARDLVAHLHALRGAERPLRLLKARLLRDAHQAGAFRALGHRSLGEFLERELGLSERTGRRFLAETFLFEDEPALARAFAAGKIGLTHAWLIRGVALADTLPGFLHRAREVTVLHFEREVRFLEALREFLPSVALEFAGPFPMPGLEGALVERLVALGWDRAAVRRALAARQAIADGWEPPVVPVEGAGGPAASIAGASESAAPSEAASGLAATDALPSPPGDDPAENPLAMRRLEILLELVVLAIEERDTRVREGDIPEPAPGLAAGGERDDRGLVGVENSSEGDAPAPSETGGQGMPTLARFAGVPEDTGLPMLARSASLDLAGRMTTIRFWAPEQLENRWKWAVSAVRGDSTPLPTWAAAMLILDNAMREWERTGRARRPAEWRILERDGWRCQVPGCSGRKSLEVHHIVFRSHGGSDEQENKLTLCHHHHQHGIHEGSVAIQGLAPSRLTWGIGSSSCQRPIPRLQGQKAKDTQGVATADPQWTVPWPTQLES